MKNQIAIDFRLQAEVNQEKFEMNGEGIGCAEEGTCILHLEASPRFPAGFDPVSCPLICGHPTNLFFARAVAADSDFPSLVGQSYQVSPARRGMIYNHSGEKLLDLQVDGWLQMKEGRLLSEHVMKGTSALPSLDRHLTPFSDYLLPSREGEATALIRFKLLARNGDELDGMTIVPYRWGSGRHLPTPFIRQIEDIQVEWDGSHHVSAYCRSSICPLSLPKEISSQILGYDLQVADRTPLPVL